MKSIIAVNLNNHVTVTGTSTRKVNAGKGITLERLEDGVSVSEVVTRDGKKVTRGLWVPDANITSLEFALEAVPEPKK